jgi:ubiquinone/menaquinone biosynthesis C-methylase UbiE
MHPTPKRMLHVAPERAFTTQLKRIPSLDYLTADLYNPRAMVKMDITDIQYPDASFDVIYCSHVLEHVPDDRKAMREFFRVLKPTGWAVLQVPITADHTIEDPSVVEPEERERLFGQKDHVRRYGPDYTQRLEEAGFTVKCIPASAVGDQHQRREVGILDDEVIYYCTRSA